MSFLLQHISIILQVLLFAIMFGMGMTLTADDFLRVGKFPKAVGIGLLNQIILLPLVGFLIVQILPLAPAIAMGLIIVCACPGGATSNLISHLSKGDTALSITLTAFSSLITIVSIPLIINFALQNIMGEVGQAIQMPLGKTILNIIKLTALPVALGLFINYRFPAFSLKSRNTLAWSSGVFILIALALLVVKLAEIGSVWSFIKAAGPAAVLLNLITLGIGFLSSRILRLNKAQAVSISIESGMQNNVLGMAIAISMLNSPEMAVAAGVYGIVMCTTGLILISVFRRVVV